MTSIQSNPTRRGATGLKFRGLLALLLSLFFALSPARPTSANSPRGPETFSHAELVRLYHSDPPPASLGLKLERLLTTPFVGRAETVVAPLKPETEGAGRVVRVAAWNIERGLEFDAVVAAFSGPEEFSRLLDAAEYPQGSPERAEVLEQARLLSQADVIVLNEVDWGLKRTDYRNVAADLASALGMHYAFGVSFVEVDPLNLGTEQFEEATESERAELRELITVETDRYLGLHGNAILSRFPLENVRLLPFKHQGHDWYAEEKKGASKIEKGKRKTGELVFREKARNNVRRGGRTMLVADVVGDELPGGRVTVVSAHLENRTKPKSRVRQLEEMLAEVKGARHPVVLAGDMNTSTRDSTPTSIRREIKKRLGSKSYWLKKGISLATGFELPFGFLRGPLNEYRKQADPTVRHVPWVAPNPEAKFFSTLKDFRFADGGAFDFRGDSERSAGGSSAVLANSNERGGKGFVTTFEVERTISFVGRFKLDWIFVKPPGFTDPEGDGQPYRFAPHYGRTLKALNFSLPDRISDHSPLIVDLPLAEPPTH